VAHVHRPEYTTAIPAHAARKGTAVRWVGRGGKAKAGVVCADNPARCRVKAECWYARYTDAAGARHDVKGFPDKAATEALLARLLQQSARVAAGLLPPEAAAPRRTLAELLALWEDTMAAERTAKHARTQRVRAERVVAAAGATAARQLTPAAVARAVAAACGALGLGAASRAHHLGAAKAFTRWLHLGERCEPADPLAGVRRRADESDPRHVRRVLDPGEFARLPPAAAAAGPSHGLTGPERAALYLTAANTGLRAEELSAVTAAAFDLAADPPAVVLPGADTKNGAALRLPLPADLVPPLAPLVAAAGGGPVWPDRTGTARNTWWRTAARMLRGDLAAAGIPYRDARGRVYDFHALRAQFITDLARAGVPLTTTQRLARHSTPTLTANTYTRLGDPDLAAGAAKLAALRRASSLTPGLTPKPGETPANPGKGAADSTG
jgi:integrase